MSRMKPLQHRVLTSKMAR